MTVTVGEPVPDFNLPATSDKDVVLSALKGWNVVIYFYPKDATPGCTTESQQFAQANDEFKKEKTVVLGVSRDSLKSHENFKAKHELPFELISDSEEELCKIFDVIKLKKMYGKEILGIERSTFLIDKEGILRQEWRKVRPEGHAESVLFAVKQMNLGK